MLCELAALVIKKKKERNEFMVDFVYPHAKVQFTRYSVDLF